MSDIATMWKERGKKEIQQCLCQEDHAPIKPIFPLIKIQPNKNDKTVAPHSSKYPHVIIF